MTARKTPLEPEPSNETRPHASRTVFTVLFMTVFLDFLGFSIVLPYLYFQARDFGASDFQYGLLLTSFSLTQLVFVPVMGRLSDLHGRRAILLVTLLGSGASFVVLGLANSLLLLFVGRALAGVMSSTFATAQAYVSDVTTETSRLKQMGILGAGIGLGFMVGPAVGGLLSTQFGYGVPAFLAAALAFGNFALAYFKLPESRRSAPAPAGRTKAFAYLRSVARNDRLVYLFAAAFVANLAFTFLDVTLAPWLLAVFGWGPLEAGLIFLYVSVVLVATQGAVVPRLGKRHSPATLLAFGLLLSTVSFIGMGLTTFAPLVLAMGGLLMFASGLVTPSFTHLITVATPPEDVGGVLGISQSIGGVARVIAPGLAVSSFTFGMSSGFVGLAFVVGGLINAVPIALLFRLRAAEGRKAPVGNFAGVGRAPLQAAGEASAGP